MHETARPLRTLKWLNLKIVENVPLVSGTSFLGFSGIKNKIKKNKKLERELEIFGATLAGRDIQTARQR